MHLQVHLLPKLTDPNDFAGDPVVVIDVLRATTTINYALAAGAAKIIPSLDVETARTLAQRHSGKVLLGGERGGRPIDGFDLGNSPADYRTDVVSGATIVFTTTNGTEALRHTTHSGRVLLGAFVNLSAIVAAVNVNNVERLHLLCAGTNGEITREDVLFAGAVIERLTTSRIITSPNQAVCTMNDSARLARAAWTDIGDQRFTVERLSDALRDTHGGRNLIQLGMQDDLRLAAKFDEFVIVPEFDPANWVITRADKMS